MTLNLWLLRDWLEEFSPTISCKKPKNEITGTRLYQPGMQMVDYALYLGHSDTFFQDGDANIVCRNQTDYLYLQTDDLFSVLNRIQDAFSFYARWYNRCMREISNGCSLSDLLSYAADIFPSPLIIVDAAQILVAHSPDLTGVVAPEDWDEVMEHQSLPERKLRQFNQTYKDSFFSTSIITIPPGFFPTKSYCKHIFVNEERLGSVILKTRDQDVTPGTLHLLRLFTGLVEEWIRSNAENAASLRLTSYFVRVLDGSLDTLPVLIRQLSLFGWDTECKKQIFAVRAPSGRIHYNMPLNRRLTGENLGVYVIPYQEQLVILCNLDMVNQADFAERLCSIMREDGYCGSSSFCFTALDQFLNSYHQALTALEHSPQAVGRLYRCQDVAMRMVAKIVSEYTSATLLHPALAAIKAHDRQHKTEYYQTLLCFLKNERHHRHTAEELFIHRNTLFQRLEKIQELWPLDLDDNEERFYLLFSFYQDSYGGEPNDPVRRRFRERTGPGIPPPPTRHISDI